MLRLQGRRHLQAPCGVPRISGVGPPTSRSPRPWRHCLPGVGTRLLGVGSVPSQVRRTWAYLPASIRLGRGPLYPVLTGSSPGTADPQTTTRVLLVGVPAALVCHEPLVWVLTYNLSGIQLLRLWVRDLAAACSSPRRGFPSDGRRRSWYEGAQLGARWGVPPPSSTSSFLGVGLERSEFSLRRCGGCTFDSQFAESPPAPPMAMPCCVTSDVDALLPAVIPWYWRARVASSPRRHCPTLFSLSPWKRTMASTRS